MKSETITTREISEHLQNLATFYKIQAMRLELEVKLGFAFDEDARLSNLREKIEEIEDLAGVLYELKQTISFQRA